MSTDTFTAHTQYGDWKGTAAADEHGGDNSFDELFEATGKVDKDNDALIGFEFHADEEIFLFAGYFHQKSPKDEGGWVPSLERDFKKQSGPIQVKQVRVEITREQFFKYFKRFNVKMVQRGLDIIGREFEIINESNAWS